ncbi:MAG TPA: hypothetical protein VNK04_14735 [Gemmataceae bacterium]|nr:hypothetical protein [Gemmataceae bacterium]
MDEIPIPGRDDERRLFHQVLSQHNEPAFARRARRVQEAFDGLLERCRHCRDEMLTMVRLRLGTLEALAGDWAALRPLLADEAQVEVLRRMHTELEPRLRVPIERTSSTRKLRQALEELAESIQHFNQRWQAHLQTVDLSAVNELRDGYNRYYVLEKECALRSPRVARLGFRRLEPLTRDELAALLPPLPVPRLRE